MQLINTIKTKSASLDVIDFNTISFDCKRVFTIRDIEFDVERGNHAHRETTQILHCVRGQIEVKYWTDYFSGSKILVPGAWIMITPLQFVAYKAFRPGSILVVYCDKGYSEDDYIRSMDDLKRLRGEQNEIYHF